MRSLIVATEARLLRGPDGVIRSDNGGRGYSFWKRYLAAFEHVSVLARVQDSPSSLGTPVVGKGVSVHALKDYRGLVGYFITRQANLRRIKSIVDNGGERSYIARVPGLIGTLLVKRLRRKGVPYGLEVVGDPQGVVLSSWKWTYGKKQIASFAGKSMRRVCSQAKWISYVTHETLQAKYPAPQAEFATNYSSVNLEADSFKRREGPMPRTPRLLMVANLISTYKGHAVLVDAVELLIQNGLNLTLRIIGEGALRGDIEERIEYRGLNGIIEMPGMVPQGDALHRELDRADIFVLPSLTEGLPRALIEAMARSLPCVATNVGGIPELLKPEFLARPGSARDLAQRIQGVMEPLQDHQRIRDENYEVACMFAADLLDARRKHFYRVISEAKAE